MEEDLYSSEFLNLAANVLEPKFLDNPDFTKEAYSPVCGSKVTIELKIDKENNKILDFGYAVEACILTRAVLAVMKEVIIGQTIEQITKAGSLLQRLLDEDETVLAEDWGVWKGLKIMETAQDYTMRHNSIMLPFQCIGYLT